MLKRIIPSRLSCFCLWIIAINTTYATEAPENMDAMPIEIQSDTAEFDDKKGTAIYRGNVVMKQGNRHLSSLKLVILRDEHGKIESMVATGTPAYFYAKSDPEKPPIQGQAKNLKYFPKQDKLLLLEEAELIQNGDTIRGCHLVYFISTHVLSSLPVPGKHTTVILTPKSKPTPEQGMQ